MLQISLLSRRERRRGVSVAEMMIACSLLAVLLGSMYAVLAPGLRVFAHGNVDAEVQQEALKAMNRVVSELGNSVREQVGVSPVDKAVWFLSYRAPEPDQNQPESFSNSGQLFWKKWICYFLDGSELIRAELPLTTPSEVVVPAPSPAPNIVDFKTATGAARRVVARSVREFDVTGISPNMFELHLAASQQVASDKATRIELFTRVHVRNQ